MKEILADPKLIAACGLYCGACRSYLKGRCPGCRDNLKATWCKVRTCCGNHTYTTCADCLDFADPKACKTFDNFIAKVFGLLFNSNRRACIVAIREHGKEAFAASMTKRRRPSLPRSEA
ncbi:MAG: hypothetical protein A2284_14085 [Deltaproteobacteria bacterium RIFOXYA12_FULL_61_11]|nr:MAG: hypothetical protein A2284_14085 [Deltaproteobacteria bacterium RIFOXYA12_FULL_61_11]